MADFPDHDTPWSELPQRVYARPDDVCSAHGRWLSKPEYEAGRCSWCVPTRGRLI